MSEPTQREVEVLSSPAFARARWVGAIAVVLSLLSMWQYPGGTSLNARTVGYSLTQNFLSDLGMTVAYNGQTNGLGAALFAASMLGMVAGCGAVVCASFVGVAFTPENRVMPLHVDFTLFAFRAALVAVALLAMNRELFAVSRWWRGVLHARGHEPSEVFVDEIRGTIRWAGGVVERRVCDLAGTTSRISADIPEEHW